MSVQEPERNACTWYLKRVILNGQVEWWGMESVAARPRFGPDKGQRVGQDGEDGREILRATARAMRRHDGDSARYVLVKRYAPFVIGLKRIAAMGVSESSCVAEALKIGIRDERDARLVLAALGFSNPDAIERVLQGGV